MSAECVMPRCTRPPTTTNRLAQTTCAQHQLVAVSGSWVGAEAAEADR